MTYFNDTFLKSETNDLFNEVHKNTNICASTGSSTTNPAKVEAYYRWNQ